MMLSQQRQEIQSATCKPKEGEERKNALPKEADKHKPSGPGCLKPKTLTERHRAIYEM